MVMYGCDGNRDGALYDDSSAFKCWEISHRQIKSCLWPGILTPITLPFGRPVAIFF